MKLFFFLRLGESEGVKENMTESMFLSRADTGQLRDPVTIVGVRLLLWGKNGICRILNGSTVFL